MALLHRELGSITVDDLQALVDNAVPESKHLDYKLQVDLSKEQRESVLADLSSFANADGGDLVVGVASSEGLPINIVGVPVVDFDQWRNRLEQILELGVSPRINYHVHAVPVSQDKLVAIVRVQRSWNPPHRVESNSRFYMRTSGRRHVMDLDELRAAFTFSGLFNRQVKTLHQELLHSIPQEFPSIGKRAYAAVHLIPYSALTKASTVDLHLAMRNSQLFGPVGSAFLTHGSQYSFDGLTLRQLQDDQGSQRVLGFSRLFRSGALQSANTDLIHQPQSPQDNGAIVTFEFEIKVISAVVRFLTLMRSSAIEGPVAVFVDVVNVLGFKLHDLNERLQRRTAVRIDKALLSLPGAIFDEVVVSRAHVARLLQPGMDTLWNAGGFDRCAHYDPDGNLTITEDWFSTGR
jgi:hypothetical protein